MTHAHALHPPAAPVRHLAAFGAGSVFFCAAAIGALHVLPPARSLSPVSQPISDYALTGAAWLFDMSVLTLATGLAALLAALVLGRYVAARSGPFAAMTASCAGLVAVVIFPDHHFGGVLATVGWVHWVAAMTAFGALPVASTLLRRRHRGESGCTRLPAVAGWLSLAAAVCFVVLFVGGILDQSTSLPVWRVGGIVERLLALSEMAVTVSMAVWAWRGCACTTVRRTAAGSGRTSAG